MLPKVRSMLSSRRRWPPRHALLPATCSVRRSSLHSPSYGRACTLTCTILRLGRSSVSWVGPDAIHLRVLQADANTSDVGKGTMLRPDAARRQELEIRPKDLPDAMVAVSGRVHGSMAA